MDSEVNIIIRTYGIQITEEHWVDALQELFRALSLDAEVVQVVQEEV